MLLGWVTKRKGGRSVVQQAIEALQEAFVNFLLPERKLKSFDQQPLQVGA
jgi:ribosome biogenesis protein MAK21